MSKKQIKITCLSDTHNMHDQIQLEETDILIHCGDATGRGRIHEHESFLNWYGKQKSKVKLLVAGNHDFNLSEEYDSPDRAYISQLLTNNDIILLENSTYEYESINFYGSPYTPTFGRWAFMLSGQEMKDNWEKIPLDTNILITHGPPYKILDSIIEWNERVQSYNGFFKNHNVGCPDLLNKVSEMKQLKLHVFGHIHESSGETFLNDNNTLFANVASLNGNYQLKKQPIQKFLIEVENDQIINCTKL